MSLLFLLQALGKPLNGRFTFKPKHPQVPPQTRAWQFSFFLGCLERHGPKAAEAQHVPSKTTHDRYQSMVLQPGVR